MTHKIKWLGHAACQVTTAGGRVILIDPWLSGNPCCPLRPEEITAADLILVTHDHYDHMGEDIPGIVERTGALVIAVPEVAARLQAAGVGQENVIHGVGMNVGGQVEVKGIKILMTEAHHSSPSGLAVGYLITLEDGKNIYHAGDTGIFAGMELLGKLYPLELALLPIGGAFVMDAYQAAFSLTLLRVRKVVPIHYQTFPVLAQGPEEFVRLAREKAPGTEVIVMEPGDELLL